jgi:hypothetical protein
MFRDEEQGKGKVRRKRRMSGEEVGGGDLNGFCIKIFQSCAYKTVSFPLFHHFLESGPYQESF